MEKLKRKLNKRLSKKQISRFRQRLEDARFKDISEFLTESDNANEMYSRVKDVYGLVSSIDQVTSALDKLEEALDAS